MAIEYTFHSPSDAGEVFRDSVLCGPSSASVAVSDGAASSALAASGLCRIVATSDSRIKTGPAVTDGANGMILYSGRDVVLWLSAGDKIGVSAL